MRDRETERVYYPQQMLDASGVAQVLCVAPHPDDEVLGCGGLLALWARQGVSVHSLILTSGDDAPQAPAADTRPAQLRPKESEQAARILGTLPPRFLGLQDRQLTYSPDLVNAITESLQQLNDTQKPPSSAPICLLLPSLAEPHPDHQATALAGLAAALAYPGSLRVLFYEVGVPQTPNAYADITAVADLKWRAIGAFVSQLGIQPYDRQARAMASLRAFGLGPACEAAEAYFEVDLQAVRQDGALAALPQWPWVRSRLQLANAPEQLPLVSVLVRSMDRPSLPETLASVALQTHAPIEVVVVNATGRPHSPLNYVPAQLALRVVQPDDGAALGRAVAANLALSQARGPLALFLDDDDLIDPGHIGRLVQALHEQPAAAGAYSGVRVLGANGQTVRDYDVPWSPHRLQAINFLPIHAVLFRTSVVQQHKLQFDPTLPVLEDWDFWRQLSAGRVLVHCPGITAVYRQSLGSSGLGDPDHQNHWKAWHLQLLQRYLARESVESTAQCLSWHAIEVDRLGTQLDLTRHELDLTRHEIEQARQALAYSQQQLAALLNSRWWRLGKPLRKIMRMLRA